MATGIDSIREMLDEEGAFNPPIAADDYRNLGADAARHFMGEALVNLKLAKDWSRSAEAVPPELRPQIAALATKAKVIVDKMKEAR